MTSSSRPHSATRRGKDKQSEEKVNAVEVVGKLRAVPGRGAQLVIELLDDRGERKRVLYPASRLIEENERRAAGRLAAQLVDAGWPIPRDSATVVRIYRVVVDRFRNGVKDFAFAPQTGWADGGFVLGRELFGKVEGSSVVIDPTLMKELGRYVPFGTLDGWKAKVAVHCRSNTRLVFVICAALAAPVLKLLDQPGFAVHLFWESTAGKTLALRIAGSVYGGPDFKRSWNKTDVGAHDTFRAAHNDLALVLDELGEAGTGIVDGPVLATFLYRLINGTARTRAYTSSYAAGGDGECRLVAFTSGEERITEHLTKRGGVVRGGLRVRVAELAAEAGEGWGVFEWLPSKDGRQMTPRELAKYLERAVAKEHGTAGPAFVSHLAKGVVDGKTPGAFSNRLRRLHDRASLRLGLAGDRMEQRLADGFAAALVAGWLGIEAGVLPFTGEEVERSVRACLGAALDAFRSNARAHDPRAAREAAQAFLCRAADRLIVHGPADGKPDEAAWSSAGVLVRAAANGLRAYVRPDVLRAGIDEVTSEPIIRALVKLGVVIGDEDNKTSRSERVVEGARPERVYVIDLDRLFAGDVPAFLRSPARDRNAVPDATPASTTEHPVTMTVT